MNPKPLARATARPLRDKAVSRAIWWDGQLKKHFILDINGPSMGEESVLVGGS